MALTPTRRTTANSTRLRPNSLEGENDGPSGEESDNSVLTERAATANAASQTGGNATANPHNAPEDPTDGSGGQNDPAESE